MTGPYPANPLMSKRPIMLRTGKSTDITQSIEHSLSSFNLAVHGAQLSIFLEIIGEASIAFIAGQYHQAVQKYKTALNIILELGCCQEYQNTIQYMLCIIWLESTLLQDLLDALKCLLKLENSIGDNFPAVYYALGKTHMKLYRFEAAQGSILKGFAFLNKEIKFHSWCIPGTDIVIKETTRQGLSDALMKLSDECSGWHPPDAVCSLKECQNFLNLYPQPNRNIFYSDPAFNGMVVITCSNSAFPCVMKFHQACWKYQKEQMSAMKKFSDKEVLGQRCFTPNCGSGNIPNTIMKVEVYGEDAQLKATIEGPNNTAWPTKVTPVKGAIKKQLPSTPVHKIRKQNILIPPQQKEVNGVKDQKDKISDELEIAWRVAKLEDLREINFGITPETNWVPDQILYGNGHMMETIHFIDLDVMNTQYAEMKVFIFEMFYEYIRNNGPLLIEDVLKKWQETQTIIENAQHILTGFIDIIEFLLQSPKIVRLEDLICTAYDLSKAYNLLEDNTIRKFSFIYNDPIQQQEIEFTNIDNETISNEISCDNNKEDLSKIVSNNGTQISEMPGETLPKTINTSDLETCKNIESTKGETLQQKHTQEDTSKVSKSGNDETKFTITDSESKNFSEHIENNYCDLNQLFSTRLSPELIHATDDLNVDRSEAENVTFITKNNPFLNNDYQEESTSINSNKDVAALYDKDMDNANSQLAINNMKQIPQQDFSKLIDDLVATNNVKKDVLEVDSVLEPAENLQKDDEGTRHLSEMNIILRKHVKEEEKVLQEETVEATESLLETVNVLKDEIQVLTQEKAEYENKIKAMQEELEDYKDKVSQLSTKICDSEKKHFDTKQKLLKECLYHQFISNKHFIMGKMDVCNAVLEAFDNFLRIFERFTGFRLQPFNAEWLQLVYRYHTMFIEHQADYNQRKLILDSAEEVEKMDEITLKLTSIPVFPKKTISDEVGDMFKKYQERLSQMTQFPRVAAVAGNPLFMRQPLLMNQPTFPLSGYQNNIAGIYPNVMPPQSSGPVFVPPPMMQHPKFQNFTMVNPQTQQPINFDAAGNVKTNQDEKIDESIKSTENLKTQEQNSAVVTNTEMEVQIKKEPETVPLPTKNVENNVSQSDPGCSSLSEMQQEEVLTSNVQADDKPESNLVPVISEPKNNTEEDTEVPPDVNNDQLPTNVMSSEEKLNALVMELKEEMMGVMELDVIESIEYVKRKNNGTLNGLTYNKIYDEAKKQIIRHQQKYLDMYVSAEEEHAQRAQLPTTSNGNRKNQQSGPSVSNNKKKCSVNPEPSLHYQALTRTADRQKLRGKSVSLDRSVKKAVPAQSLDKQAHSSAKTVWIPITTPNQGWQKEYPDSECVICMSNISDKHKATYTLTCKHTFHKVCIKDWFKQSQSCPICRVHCIIDDEFPPLPL